MTELASRETFFRAHSRALRDGFIAQIAGKPGTLLPFEAIVDTLKVYEQIPRPKPEMIPLDKVVGSVGRYKDFTRDFLPRNPALAERWARVENAMESLEGVPPIDVYQVGEVYFVADGNHRVSVARANGFQDIEAYVTEIPVDMHIAPGDTLDEAIMKAERARFLTETGLARRVEHLDIYFTKPGGFVKLLEHVKIHQRLLSQEAGREVALEEAAEDWHRTSYGPIIQVIRERNLLHRFPGRTAADLYVWIWGYIFDIYRRFGEKVDPHEAVAMMELRAGSRFQQTVHALMGTLNELSRSVLGGSAEMPDWVTQTFEWNDGSLNHLAGEEDASV